MGRDRYDGQPTVPLSHCFMSDPSLDPNPLPVDSSGAADRMVYVYDAATDGPVLAPVAPIDTSAQATEAGRTLVANGWRFVDVPSAPWFAGEGAPSASDGVEGAFWLDRSAHEVYGPKGAELPGQWPAQARRALVHENGRYRLDEPLVLGQQSLHANAGVAALKVTSFASPPSQPGGGYVGLELVVGSDESVAGGLGWVALRPQGSEPSSRKHLRLGGHQGGEVQDLQGRRYLVSDDLPEEFLRATPKTLALTAGQQAHLEWAAPTGIGVWTPTTNGIAVPRAGSYRLTVQLVVHASAGEHGEVQARWRVAGADPAGAAVIGAAWPRPNHPDSLQLTTRIVLQAGDEISLQVEAIAGQPEVQGGLGQVLIERVA